MASVWLAHNENIDKLVAIKLLRAEVTKDKEAVARFMSEAKAAARIGSEHIAEVYDAGTCPLGPYIVMEALTGQDLAAVIDEQVRMRPSEAVPIMLDVLEALEDAHRAGIVHRDLKPGNIFLHHPMPGVAQTKLMDFGVSKFLDGTNDATTRDGILLGTPEYMAPEQLQGAHQIDRRADVFSVGAVLYRALTGEYVFKGPTLAAVIVSMSKDEPIPIRELVPEISEALAEVIHKALQRDPERRYQSANELAAALRPFAGGAKASPVAIAPTEEARAIAADVRDEEELTTAVVPARVADMSSRWQIPALFALGLGLLAVGGYWLMKGPPREGDEEASASESGPSPAGDSALPAADDGEAGEPPTPLPGVHDEPGTSGSDETGGESGGDTGHAETGAETGGLAPGEDTEGDTGDDGGGDAEGDTEGEDTEGEDTEGDTDSTDGGTWKGGDGPPPSGTIAGGNYITLKSRPGTTDHAGAKRYCATLARNGHLGVSGWHLASPTIARKFIGNSRVRSGTYWTSALWKGKAITFKLPGGKKDSDKADKKGARPLCVAKW